jgi:hypothetical protein
MKIAKKLNQIEHGKWKQTHTWSQLCVQDVDYKNNSSNFIVFLKINPTITKECGFLKQKTTIDDICEINFVVSSIIMYNM